MVTRRHLGAALTAVTAAAALAGCGGKGITSSSLQTSIARTFSNLYVLQQVDQGNPRPNPASLHAAANCQKGTASAAQEGAGNDWVCYISYEVDGPATVVTATYNVNVQTDGCYAADGDGPTSLNGTRTIAAAGNQQVVNPLWLIDGCFDVS
jgi:ABC-2 type transport system permease protein